MIYHIFSGHIILRTFRFHDIPFGVISLAVHLVFRIYSFQDIAFSRHATWRHIAFRTSHVWDISFSGHVLFTNEDNSIVEISHRYTLLMTSHLILVIYYFTCFDLGINNWIVPSHKIAYQPWSACSCLSLLIYQQVYNVMANKGLLHVRSFPAL